MSIRKPPPRTFEIGLVMAGAVSAGAYTAGVIDFLLEALEAWEQAKKSRLPGVPDHRVQIRVATGSSAGGLISALMAMVPFTGHYPIRDLAHVTMGSEPENAGRNLLYRCWVRDIDIRALLQTSDVSGNSGLVPSLFDGNAVAAIADGAVASVRAAIEAGVTAPPPYFANPLQLILCMTNMRGLPYVIEMVTAGGVRGHRVVSHADYAHFAVHGSGAAPAEPMSPGVIPVNWPGTTGIPAADGWSRLRDAALATSAFPVGLPARTFANDPVLYQARPWPIPAGVPTQEPVPNLWPDVSYAAGRPYDFWCVDGGLINNEPLEAARVALSGAPDAHNARDPRQCDRAVLMIDPLPDDIEGGERDTGEMPDMLGTLFSLVPALRDQARFKPEELVLALHEDVHSRFLIAPLRPEKTPPQTHLASVGLAGFAGFFDQQLRMHDFQLGRRNCQKFLQDHFVVHVDNPIVAPWIKRQRDAGNRSTEYHPQVLRADGRIVPDLDYVQLVPLVGSLCERLQLRPWPTLDRRNLQEVQVLIDRRAQVIMPEVVRGLLSRIHIDDSGLINRLIQAVANRVIRTSLVEAATTAVRKDLSGRGLI